MRGIVSPRLIERRFRQRISAEVWRRALAIGLAFSFLGDTGLVEWALEAPLVNETDPLTRYERVSPRISLSEYIGLSMSAVHRWEPHVPEPRRRPGEVAPGQGRSPPDHLRR